MSHLLLNMMRRFKTKTPKKRKSEKEDKCTVKATHEKCRQPNDITTPDAAWTEITLVVGARSSSFSQTCKAFPESLRGNLFYMMKSDPEERELKQQAKGEASLEPQRGVSASTTSSDRRFSASKDSEIPGTWRRYYVGRRRSL